MTIRKDLLEILACPQCRGKLLYHEKKDGLVCTTCRLVYAIKDGIPIMLIDKATRLDDKDNIS